MNVLICGYYGFNNAGDELILENLIHQIKQKYPNKSTITVLSNNPSQTNMIFKTASVNRWNPFSIIFSLFSADILILGGGGLFQDKTSNLSLYYYFSVLLLAKILFKKTYICAVTINSLKKINRKIACIAAVLAEEITLREQGSLDLLRSWGVERQDITVTGDPVFMSERFIPKAYNKTPTIAFILRDSIHKGYDPKPFSEIVNLSVSNLSAKIVFIPFHRGVDEFFVSKVNTGGYQVVNWNTIDGLQQEFAKIDMVVSQRLHGLILASIAGIPMAAITDDPKITRFMSEMGRTYVFSPVNINPFHFYEALNKIWINREIERESILMYSAVMKNRAEKNITFL